MKLKKSESELRKSYALLEQSHNEMKEKLKLMSEQKVNWMCFTAYRLEMIDPQSIEIVSLHLFFQDCVPMLSLGGVRLGLGLLLG